MTLGRYLCGADPSCPGRSAGDCFSGIHGRGNRRGGSPSRVVVAIGNHGGHRPGVLQSVPLNCRLRYPSDEAPPGAAFSLLMVSGNLGAAVVPPGMGLMGDSVGLGNSLLVPAALFGGVAVLMVFHQGTPEGSFRLPS